MAERPLASYKGDSPFFFVSYGHDDVDLAFPEIRWLQDAGFNLWYDEGIHVGAVWRQAIADALSNAAGMLFLVTRTSVESSNCLKELNFALDEDKPVFVVQLDDTKLPSLLRLSLSDRQMLDKAAFSDAEYRQRLTEALATVAPAVGSAPVGEAERKDIPTVVPSIGVQVLSTGDDETAFWAEGLLHDLATLLGYRPFPISVTHDATKDLRALGREMDVSYVLSGNVRHSGESYRVNFRLTRGGTGAQVWGARYDEAGDPLAASDAIARTAAIEISAAVMDDERKRVGGLDADRLDAWGLCMKALTLSLNTIQRHDEALRLLRLAVERDPSFAQAHSMLGGFLSQAVMTMFSRRPDADAKEAVACIDRALVLAPSNPLIMFGAVTTHRVFGNEAIALDLAERANEAGGSDALFGVRGLANTLFPCLIALGREDEAIERMLASKPVPATALSNAYTVKHDWENALQWAQRAATTYPNYYLAWVEIANASAMLDRLDDAQAAMARAMGIVPTFKLALYEKGLRIAWRNRERIVNSFLMGLRKLDLP